MQCVQTFLVQSVLEKHLFWWQQRQTRSSMSKVNNNNQQITAIKRVITARDNRDKKTLLSHQLVREGGWGEGGVEEGVL